MQTINGLNATKWFHLKKIFVFMSPRKLNQGSVQCLGQTKGEPSPKKKKMISVGTQFPIRVDGFCQVSESQEQTGTESMEEIVDNINGYSVENEPVVSPRRKLIGRTSPNVSPVPSRKSHRLRKNQTSGGEGLEIPVEDDVSSKLITSVIDDENCASDNDSQGDQQHQLGSSIAGPSGSSTESPSRFPLNCPASMAKASALLVRKRQSLKVPWSSLEIKKLERGINIFGCGRWECILEYGKNVFHPKRSAVDLKDKYRNLRKNELIAAPASPPEDKFEMRLDDEFANENEQNEGNRISTVWAINHSAKRSPVERVLKSSPRTTPSLRNSSRLRRCRIIDSEPENDQVLQSNEEVISKERNSIHPKEISSHIISSSGRDVSRQDADSFATPLATAKHHENIQRSSSLKKYPSSSALSSSVVRFQHTSRVPWSETEIDKLKRGIQMYGRGDWVSILIYGKNVFHPKRRPVDLKDKFRNLQKYDMI